MAQRLSVNVGQYSDVPTQGLRMTTVSPGGCGELSWEYQTRPPWLGTLDLLENDRVEVFDGQGLVWRGRLEERDPTLAYQSGLWRVTALGYMASLRDQFYSSSKTFAAATAIETIFTTVRDDLCPDISTSNTLVVATGRTLSSATAELVGKNAHDIFVSASQFGASDNARLYWHVWEGTAGTGQEAVLELVKRPTTVGYYVSLSHGAIVNLNWSLSRLYNRIVVVWGRNRGTIPDPTDGPATADALRDNLVATTILAIRSNLADNYTVVNDTVSQGARPDGYGVIRAMEVRNDAVNSSTDATNVGNTLLQQYKDIRAHATAIRIPEIAAISDAEGATIVPWRVKAGQIVRIRELRAGASATREHDFLIARTDWDENSRYLTLTPEGLEGVDQAIARFLRSERLT